MDCPRFNKWIRGCKFEARYDEGAPAVNDATGFSDGVVRVIRASKSVTYVRDVCVRCGRTIERPK